MAKRIVPPRGVPKKDGTGPNPGRGGCPPSQRPAKGKGRQVAPRKRRA